MLVSPRPLFNETPTPCPVLWLVVKPYLYGYVGKGFYLPLTGTSNYISSPTFLPVPRPQASEVGFLNFLFHPTLSHYSPSCLATRYLQEKKIEGPPFHLVLQQYVLPRMRARVPTVLTSLCWKVMRWLYPKNGSCMQLGMMGFPDAYRRSGGGYKRIWTPAMFE